MEGVDPSSPRDSKLDVSRPGRPTDNAFIESLNGKFRAECLNTHWFMSLDEARRKCEAWRRDYNPASQHPSVYAIDVNRLCCSRCGPAGYREPRFARSASDRATGPSRTTRLKSQG